MIIINCRPVMPQDPVALVEAASVLLCSSWIHGRFSVGFLLSGWKISFVMLLDMKATSGNGMEVRREGRVGGIERWWSVV